MTTPGTKTGCHRGTGELLGRRLAGFLVPGDRFAEAVAEFGRRRPAETLAGAGGVETPARLPVGLGRVPAEAALVATHFADQFRECLDGDFLAAAQVDRVGVVVAFRRGDDSRAGVL